MVVVVHLSQDNLVANVGDALEKQAVDLLAPAHLSIAHLDVETVEQVLKDGRFDNTHAHIVDLSQSVQNLCLLAIEVVLNDC